MVEFIHNCAEWCVKCIDNTLPFLLDLFIIVLFGVICAFLVLFLVSGVLMAIIFLFEKIEDFKEFLYEIKSEE